MKRFKNLMFSLCLSSSSAVTYAAGATESQMFVDKTTFFASTMESYLPVCLVDRAVFNGDAQAIRLEISGSGAVIGTLETVNLWHFRLDNRDGEQGADHRPYPLQIQVYSGIELVSGNDGSTTFKADNFEVRLSPEPGPLGDHVAGTANLTTSDGRTRTFTLRQARFAGGLSKTCSEDIN